MWYLYFHILSYYCIPWQMGVDPLGGFSELTADGFAICLQVPTGFEILSLVILTLGVVLSIWEGSIAGSPPGICIALASTLCGAAMLNFSGKVHRLYSFSSRLAHSSIHRCAPPLHLRQDSTEYELRSAQ